MLNETTITEWFEVTFFDAPPPNRILWGIIAEDPSGRWFPGDYVCTSPVLKKTDDSVYITKNSKYFTTGPGHEIEIPVKALIELRMGIAPDECSVLQQPNSQGLRRRSEQD